MTARLPRDPGARWEATDELRKLSRLKADGEITTAEYERRFQELMKPARSVPQLRNGRLPLGIGRVVACAVVLATCGTTGGVLLARHGGTAPPTAGIVTPGAQPTSASGPGGAASVTSTHVPGTASPGAVGASPLSTFPASSTPSAASSESPATPSAQPTAIVPLNPNQALVQQLSPTYVLVVQMNRFLQLTCPPTGPALSAQCLQAYRTLSQLITLVIDALDRHPAGVDPKAIADLMAGARDIAAGVQVELKGGDGSAQIAQGIAELVKGWGELGGA